MKKSAFILALLVLATVLVVACSSHSKPLPPYPRPQPKGPEEAQPDTLKRPEAPGAKVSSQGRKSPSKKDKARSLFDLARRENTRLKWDRCLATKAYERAKEMVRDNYFSHDDPKTGRNPAWTLVSSCLECKYAGENLAMGFEPPEVIHQTLMESETHRKNIVNPRHNRLGVGCYKHICVELFAGV